ncbi:hypothetical protein [Streptomyces mangrovi]|uniref:hypothetical protein n=1 Tax=Streptomyces mangrovi TaxID=1206892 RepID=UPI00399C886A
MELLPDSDAGARLQRVRLAIAKENAKLPSSVERGPHGGMGADAADQAVTPLHTPADGARGDGDGQTADGPDNAA